ncbi:hypothetical protein [Spiribacter onubensis]|uniref:Uncharacterized protein n=1 Tax=Spiribacter onubensis TaxID=3122420 RepID=A0ABV3S6T5_9GAMM
MSERDREAVKIAIDNQSLPCVVSIKTGAKRSLDQNRLQRQWLNEAATQGDQTAEEYRAYCKLHIGVPILRSEDEDFRVQYDAIIKPLPYEQKLLLMQEPIAFPVTSLMTTSQMGRYLDAMYVELSGQGLVLTEPKDAA